MQMTLRYVQSNYNCVNYPFAKDCIRYMFKKIFHGQINKKFKWKRINRKNFNMCISLQYILIADNIKKIPITVCMHFRYYFIIILKSHSYGKQFCYNTGPALICIVPIYIDVNILSSNSTLTLCNIRILDCSRTSALTT